jgi:hypothetical protein
MLAIRQTLRTAASTLSLLFDCAPSHMRDSIPIHTDTEMHFLILYYVVLRIITLGNSTG